MGLRLLIFGPPGVGKGTHARRLAADLGVPHIATGDMLRQAIKDGTPLGRKADAQMRSGELVSDDLVLARLDERLGEADAQNGFVLEGFPRTCAQAAALLTRMDQAKTRVDAVLSLEAPEALLVERVLSRDTCSTCGASFNRVTTPARVPGRCNACGGPLSRRQDDNEIAIRRRLTEYLQKTAPVIDYFRANNWPVSPIPAAGEVDEIYGRIARVVGL